jgi:glycosyltransferase involved in cell wall biosynthesis
VQSSEEFSAAAADASPEVWHSANREDAHGHGTPSLLFVVNVAWFFASHRLSLARAAISAGFHVHLASDLEHESEVTEIRRWGIQFHRMRVARSGLNPVDEVKTIRELRRIMRLVRPDIVHNVTAKPVIYGSQIAHALGITGVVNAMSGFGYAYSAGRGRRWLRGAMDMAYARAFNPQNVRIVVQNEDDRAEVLRICPGATARIRLIPGSGVDLREFGNWPEPEGTPTVVLPARLLREKGVCEFAAAAAELRRSGLAARFVLAGRLDAANRGALTAEQVRELCMESGLEWIGDCTDMPRLFRESHIVCLPSYREGMPKVLLEACASGRAIITTDTPGCRDAIQRGRNGLLVPPRDVQALAMAIRELVEDAPRRKRMGAEARMLAEREFGVEDVVRTHLEMYRELLDLPAGPVVSLP